MDTNPLTSPSAPLSAQQEDQIRHLLAQAQHALEKNPSESLSLAQQAHTLAAAARLLLPEAQAALSDGYRATGQFQQSLDTAREALGTTAQTHPSYARLLVGAGASATFLSQHSEGMAYLTQGLELAQLQNDDLVVFRALNGIGANYVDVGDLHQGAEHFRKALQVAQQSPRVSRESISMLNYNLSVTLSMQGLVTEALAPADTAIRIARETGSPRRTAAALLQKGFLHLELHEPLEAEQCLQESLQISSQIADPVTEQSCYLGLGKVRIQQHDLQGAVPMLEAALHDRYQTKYETLRAYQDLVDVHKRLGQHAQALQRYEETVILERELAEKKFDSRFHELEIKYRTELALREKAQVEKEREWLKTRNATLTDLVTQRTEQLEKSHLEMLEALAVAGAHRNGETGQHTERVGEISKKVALKLGLSDILAERIRVTARLHDIGKIAIPDEILLKPGKLTQEEFDLMKQHTVLGAEILSKGTSAMVRLAHRIALHHHERWDGRGYPAGLSGEHIPIEARIVSIADVFDALTHLRPYKRAWTVEEALAEISRVAGTQFDPWVVQAFMQVMQDEQE